jgi:ABC-type sugar transport system permease subunit
MASAAVKRPAQVISSRGRLILSVIAVLLVILNVVYFVFLRQSGNTIEVTQAIPGGNIILATNLDEHRAVALTSDNHLVVVEDGKRVSDKLLDKTVTAMDTWPDGSRLVGGTSDRDVIIWDNQLNELKRFTVNGRVTGVKIADDGNIVISYGIGRFAGKFWIAKYNADGKQLFVKQNAQDISTVTASKDLAVFGAVNGDIAAVNSGGKQVWKAKTVKPLTTLDVTTDGRIIGADERGMVYLINPENGKAVWQQKLSEYKMGMVVYDAQEDKIVAGDDDGKLFLLNMDGKPFYQTVASTSPIRGYLHATGGNIYAVSASGEWININLGLAMGAHQQQTTNSLALASNVVLICGFLATMVATMPRLRVPTLRIAKRIKDSRIAYLLIAPSMILTLLFAYVPTVMGLYYSFTNFNLAEPIKFIGLQNFVRIGSDQFFWTGVGNMLLILVTSMIKVFTIPLLIAELIFWLRWARVKYVMRVAFIIPSIVPGVVGVLLWKQIYDPQIGLLNEILKSVGLASLAHPWLSDSATAIWAIIFTGFPWVDIFAFLIFFGGLLNINHEIFDAAAIDGASAWNRFFNVDLQMIRPQLNLIMFFTFLGSVQGYGNIWIMTRGGPGTATYVPGLQMFTEISAAEFGYASSIGFVLALAVLLVTVLRFRFNETPDAA